MKTQTVEVGTLEPGDEFTHYDSNNSKGYVWTISHVGEKIVVAYMNNDIDADDPTEFAPNELVEIATK